MARFSPLVLLLVLAGCGGEEEAAPREAPSTPRTPAAAPSEPAAPSGPDLQADPLAETDSYVLELRPAESYRAGELSQFTLAIEGQNGWHLNAEFPFEVNVAHVDALSLPKAELGREDAANFGEEGVQMDVPLTPSSAGEHALSTRVEFAVCNPTSCVPVTETVGLRLAVADGA